MIEIIELKKQYQNNVVLDIPTLTIQNGECIGLVGNNGAGKTTLFSILLDLIYPTTGLVKNSGFVVQTDESWKSFTTSFIDESFLISYLTPEEYFYFIGEVRGIDKASVQQFVLQFEDLFNGEILDNRKYLRDLSKGNQKKVGIVAALIGDPRLIILDEPFANLDPSTQFRLKKILKTYADKADVTLLISSHDLMHTVDVCTRIIALNKGQVVLDKEKNADTLATLESFFAID